MKKLGNENREYRVKQGRMFFKSKTEQLHVLSFRNYYVLEFKNGARAWNGGCEKAISMPFRDIRKFHL